MKGQIIIFEGRNSDIPVLEMQLANEKEKSIKYLEMMLGLGYSQAEIEHGQLQKDNISEYIQVSLKSKSVTPSESKVYENQVNLATSKESLSI